MVVHSNLTARPEQLIRRWGSQTTFSVATFLLSTRLALEPPPEELLPVPYGIRTGRPSNSISNASIHCLVILKTTGSKFHHRLIEVVSCPFEEELKHNGQICTFKQDIETLSSRNRLIAGTAALPTTWLISVYIGESELETRVSVFFKKKVSADGSHNYHPSCGH